jgi:hypothetical protein
MLSKDSVDVSLKLNNETHHLCLQQLIQSRVIMNLQKLVANLQVKDNSGKIAIGYIKEINFLEIQILSENLMI